VAEVTVAFTHTGVGIVPDCTETDTSPLPSVTFDTGELVPSRSMPPILVVKSNKTVAPVMGWLLLSNTLNMTRELSIKPAPPVPLSTMVWGFAETYWMLTALGDCTVSDIVLETARPATLAVIVSVVAQPLST